MAAFRNRLQSASPEVRAVPANSAQIDEYVDQLIQADGPGLALAVAIDGAIVHAAGYGLADVAEGVPVTPDTMFHLASCGKQFTGLGVLMLAEEGRLGLDDPIGRHLGELAGFGPDVTIRQLLHHTSGIRDLYDDGGVEILKRNKKPTNADLVRTYSELGCPMAQRGVRPGDVFSYSNAGYELLGSVIERVSGQTYRDFFQGRVFGPLGMSSTFSIPDIRMQDPRCAAGYVLDDRDEFAATGADDFENLVGAGSFYTTVMDLCRYEQALRSDTLVNNDVIQQAFVGANTNDGQPTDYGFGWYIGDDNGSPYAQHEGLWNGYYSFACVYLEQEFSLFVLTNRPGIVFQDLINAVVAATND